MTLADYFGITCNNPQLIFWAKDRIVRAVGHIEAKLWQNVIENLNETAEGSHLSDVFFSSINAITDNLNTNKNIDIRWHCLIKYILYGFNCLWYRPATELVFLINLSKNPRVVKILQTRTDIYISLHSKQNHFQGSRVILNVCNMRRENNILSREWFSWHLKRLFFVFSLVCGCLLHR